MFTNALFLEVLNVGNSNLEDKSMAEVDAAGRYISHPVGVQRVQCTLTHTLRVYHIYHGAGVNSVCFIPEVSYDLKRRTSRGKMPRFLFVWLLHKLTRPTIGYRRTQKEENK